MIDKSQKSTKSSKSKFQFESLLTQTTKPLGARNKENDIAHAYQNV